MQDNDELQNATGDDGHRTAPDDMQLRQFPLSRTEPAVTSEFDIANRPIQVELELEQTGQEQEQEQ